MRSLMLHQEDNSNIVATIYPSKDRFILSVYFGYDSYNIKLGSNEIKQLKRYLNELPIETNTMDK